LPPVVEDGTLNDAVNDPELLVVTVDGEVVTGLLLNRTVIVEDAEKPWPIIVTLEPIRPLVGLTLIEAVLTVNVAVA